MAAINPTLFSWDHFEETTPELKRFELVKEYLPDDGIIKALRDQRGKGRNDFPIEAMWNVLLAGIVFQHQSVASVLRELSRNRDLLQACGFNPLPLQKKPKPIVSQDEYTGKAVVFHRKRLVKDGIFIWVAI